MDPDAVEPRASFVQDLFVRADPRLRARRFAPFAGAPVRLLFHLDQGEFLEEPALRSFLEALASRIEIVAVEPRGQGGSGGRLGQEILGDFNDLVEDAPRRWPDDLPLLAAGGGLGGAVALAVGAHPALKGIAALGPLLAAPAADGDALAWLGRLDLPRRARALGGPLWILAPRDDPRTDHAALAALASARPQAALTAIPGGGRAFLEPPWPALLAEWALWAGGASARR